MADDMAWRTPITLCLFRGIRSIATFPESSTVNVLFSPPTNGHYSRSHSPYPARQSLLHEQEAFCARYPFFSILFPSNPVHAAHHSYHGLALLPLLP